MAINGSDKFAYFCTNFRSGPFVDGFVLSLVWFNYYVCDYMSESLNLLQSKDALVSVKV